jgi:BolA protein
MTVEQIKERLTAALKPEYLQVIDNSQAHADHAGAQRGGGHYHVRIAAGIFSGKSLVQRHQLVYKALGELMKDQIHALGIEAMSPDEITINKGNHSHE